MIAMNMENKHIQNSKATELIDQRGTLGLACYNVMQAYVLYKFQMCGHMMRLFSNVSNISNYMETCMLHKRASLESQQYINIC